MSKFLKFSLFFAFLSLLIWLWWVMPQPTPANKAGLHLLLDDGRNSWPTELWPEHLYFAHQAIGEGGYITQLVRLDDLNPAKWQLLADLCTQYQLRPIIRLATTYNHDKKWWEQPPADSNGRYHTVAQQYATFLSHITWATPPVVVVGNEPNHGDEWGGVPDPAAYAHFLVDVAQAIHQTLPEATVLNAGLDLFTPHTNGQPFVNGLVYLDAESFMDGMVQADPAVFTHLDGWASHPYPLGPFTAPPWEQTYQVDWLNGATNPHHQTPPAGIFNRGVNGYEWELWKLSTYGVNFLPVYITETGWRHEETVDLQALDNAPAGLPSAAVMSRYVEVALWGNTRYPEWPTSGWTPWIEDERVVAVTFFALNGRPAEWGHTNWLQMTADGRINDMYPAFFLLNPRDSLKYKSGKEKVKSSE